MSGKVPKQKKHLFGGAIQRVTTPVLLLAAQFPFAFSFAPSLLDSSTSLSDVDAVDRIEEG